MSDTPATEVHRAPNGIPYIDMDESSVRAWESGEFMLRLKREDGEMMNINITGEQLQALEEASADTRTKAVEKPEVDYDG